MTKIKAKQLIDDSSASRKIISGYNMFKSAQDF